MTLDPDHRPLDTDQATEPPDQRQSRPGPFSRRGPRPLLFHLMLAAARSSNSTAASQIWNAGWPNWADVLATMQAGPEADASTNERSSQQASVQDSFKQAMLDDRAMIAGIAAYRRHPYQRTLQDPQPIWQEGSAQLLDYAPGHPGVPVVFVPSLINRGYILDLAPQQSLLRYLAEAGLHPVLLDWGWPGPVERCFTLTDYIVGLLERAVTSLHRPIRLVGYCMGGLLSLAFALRRPDLVRALALLATPWDFKFASAKAALGLANILPMLEPVLEITGTLPVDALQALFALLDPLAVARKFRRFGKLPQESARAQQFVAIEDWLNDGVPLAAPVARECFAAWYGRNEPHLGNWRIAGMAVTPEALDVPCFVAIPGKDQIVPPDSARALLQRLPQLQVIEPVEGHVSMVVGTNACVSLWQPLARWLLELPPHGPRPDASGD